MGSKSYVPFDEDFATVNPYLGSDGVKPFIEVLSLIHIYFWIKCWKAAGVHLHQKKQDVLED